jgi:transcription initiation factor IIE alpha subunit|tara:strand:+ start:2688 stop:2924 length:237 start_codon:yes stop_codon:yes gene_type:complete
MEQVNDPNILRKQVDKIDKELDQLEKEKEIIQNDCKHKGETFVQFDKSNSMKKYCSDCKRELGYPTKEEQETFLGKKQ